MKARTPSTPPAGSVQARARLVEALKLDLVGPWAGHALAEERLLRRDRPSNWYLTGFLIPAGTPPEKSADHDEDNDRGEIPESAGLAEESNEERKAAKKGFFPSSMGLSFLVPGEAEHLDVTVRWGDYALEEITEKDGKPEQAWRRQPREASVRLALKGKSDPVLRDVPDSGGLQLHAVEQLISGSDLEQQIAAGTRSVSVFLVNRRTPISPEKGEPDLAYAFQAEIEVRSDTPFVPRPDVRGALSEGLDELTADLHYADTPSYATGHGVSAEWEVEDSVCRVLRTVWIPSAEVEKTETAKVAGVELSMEALGALADGNAAEKALAPLVDEYRNWIRKKKSDIGALAGKRRDAAEELLRLAGIAADRMKRRNPRSRTSSNRSTMRKSCKRSVK